MYIYIYIYEDFKDVSVAQTYPLVGIYSIPVNTCEKVYYLIVQNIYYTSSVRFM